MAHHNFNKNLGCLAESFPFLSEAIRVTKPGGVIFAAYVISDGCLLDEGFHRGNISVSEYIEKGLLDPQTFAANSEPKDLFELVRKEDIDELMTIFPVNRLHYVAADGCAPFMREALDAVDFLTETAVDLVLLDWMMPVQNGIETLKEIRQLNLPVKVLMLTAKGANEHEITGLSCGADDYLRKPFDIQVLLLRIKKLCGTEGLLTFRGIRLNPVTMEVTKDHQAVTLTKTEFELLKYFLLNQNIVLTREQLLNQVWGIDYEGDPRTVDTNIRRLRKKIGEDFIRTRIGMGYVMGGGYD